MRKKKDSEIFSSKIIGHVPDELQINKQICFLKLDLQNYFLLFCLKKNK